MKDNARDTIKREADNDEVALAGDVFYHDEEYGLIPAIKVSSSHLY